MQLYGFHLSETATASLQTAGVDHPPIEAPAVAVKT